MNNPPDPKTVLKEFLRDGENPSAGRVSIPWIPVAKKNDYRGLVRYRDPKTRSKPYAIVVPGGSTQRQEDAIGLLWDATQAFDNGEIDEKTFGFLRSISKRGAFSGNGVGPAAIQKARDKARLREKTPLFEKKVVKMDIEVIVGASEASDRTEVRVEEVGDRPTRRRTGLKRDTINVPAVVADALNKLAYDDDADVVELRVRLTYDE